MSQALITSLQKPHTDQLAWGRPINKGLLFAYNAGWKGGFRADGGGLEDGAKESVGQNRGSWSASPDASNYDRDVHMGGYSVSSGTGLLTLDFADILSRYDITRGMTVAVLFRPSALSGPDNPSIIVRKRPDFTAGSGGWDLRFRRANFGNQYEGRLSTGGSELTLTAFGVAADVTRTVMLMFGNNALTSPNSTSGLWVNGIQEAGSTFTAKVGNVTDDIKLFGPNGEVIPVVTQGNIGALFLWERFQTDQNAMDIASDPFLPWRPLQSPMALPTPANQDFFLTF